MGSLGPSFLTRILYAAPDAFGPNLDEAIAAEKAKKANMRFSLSPSAVSTLPEYGYGSFDFPPAFSELNPLFAREAVERCGVDDQSSDGQKDHDLVTHMELDQHTLDPQEGRTSEVGYAI